MGKVSCFFRQDIRPSTTAATTRRTTNHKNSTRPSTSLTTPPGRLPLDLRLNSPPAMMRSPSPSLDSSLDPIDPIDPTYSHALPLERESELVKQVWSSLRQTLEQQRQQLGAIKTAHSEAQDTKQFSLLPQLVLKMEAMTATVLHLEAEYKTVKANMESAKANIRNQNKTVKTALTPQELQSGLPIPSPYRHQDPLLMQQHNSHDVRPLTRQELSGTREPLISNILRDARIGVVKPILVASYDYSDGKRYIWHKDLVKKFEASSDARKCQLLKKEFFKPLTSLTTYRMKDRMTDENCGRRSALPLPLPTHLRDRQRLMHRQKQRDSERRTHNKGERIKREQNQGGIGREEGRLKNRAAVSPTTTTTRRTRKRKKKKKGIFQESSLIVDNRAPYAKGEPW